MNTIEKLIIRSQHGDTQAFTEIIHYIREYLVGIAYAKLGNDVDVEDAIQETMINAYRGIKALRRPEFFKTWISRILINECNKIIKKNIKQRKISKDAMLEIINMEVYSNNNEILDVEEKVELESALKKLNFKEQEVLRLYFSNNYSVAEIAGMLKTSINTINSRIQRSKDKIKKYIEGGRKNGKTKS